MKGISREEVDRASVTITIEANTFTLRLRVSGFACVNFKRAKIKIALVDLELKEVS